MPMETYRARIKREHAEREAQLAEGPGLRARVVELEAELEAAKKRRPKADDAALRARVAELETRVAELEAELAAANTRAEPAGGEG